MSSDRIHDVGLCAERRGRTPARSIDAAILGDQHTAAIDDQRMVILPQFLEHVSGEWCDARACFKASSGAIFLRCGFPDLHLRCYTFHGGESVQYRESADELFGRQRRASL